MPNPVRNVVSRNIKQFGILAVVLILFSSYSLFFYFQHETQKQVKSQIFEQQKERQLKSTKEVADHIGSDLALILSYLDSLSNSRYLQEGQFYGPGIQKLADEKFGQMNKIVDRLFMLNDDNTVVVARGNSSGAAAPLGNNLSFRTWVKETHETMKPVFSVGFEHLGEYRVFITSPIIDGKTGKYVGLVGVSLPTIRFFEHYGNVHDINSQFLAVLDKRGTILAIGASENLVGLNFFGKTVQYYINNNSELNTITGELLQGKTGYAVYDFGKGERLTTYQPIYVLDNPTYFLQVVTPTATLYSQIDQVLLTESMKMGLLVLGSTVASIVLIIFLLFWNSSLKKEVQKRTQEIQLYNKRLEETNEELTESERRQKEFINIAAHEIRTPIQPIIGLSGIVEKKMSDLVKEIQMGQIQSESTPQASTLSVRSDPQNPFRLLSISAEIKSMIDVMDRNARRLKKLTDNLLDFSRIENNSLKLMREQFCIYDLISDCLNDLKQYAAYKSVRFSFMSASNDQKITVYADRSRISQVLVNLLDNAIKYGQEGSIINVSTKLNSDGNMVVVSVIDTGQGITSSVLPKLFTRFGTGSAIGTGLGLYISKKIIEAHGGEIWAENNSDGKGATFSFTLPIVDK